jgi:hypothetical protein
MMGLLASLDRFVHVRRLDFMTPYSERRPRNLRWLPLLILAGLVAGYVLQVVAARGGGWSVPGSMVFVLAMVAANVIRLFGPRLMGDPAGPLDEREQMLNARAHAVSGMAFLWLITLGCFWFAFAASFGMWVPAGGVEWMLLGLAIYSAAQTLPVLVASWLQPRLDEED